MMSSTIFCILLLSALPVAYTFDRDKCYQSAQWLLGNDTISSQSDLFFRDDFGSPAYSGADNLTLTYQGCIKICGPKQTWYTDVGPRLTIWLIPILLLLANVELSPLDKRNYCAILHLLGDPIDSIWSLLHKLDSWDWCSKRAARLNHLCSSCQRVIATVLAGFEEVQGSRIKSEKYFDALLQQRSLHMSFSEWRRPALQLADARTDELGRTVFAFLLYLLQLIGAFVPEVGGVPPGPPGGRIATGVLLSWLVPAILLTNLVGNLSSRRTAYVCLDAFARRTSEEVFEHLESHSVFLPSFPSLARARTTNYFDSLSWAGGIYTYRPWKTHSSRTSQHPHLRNLRLLILAMFPVFFGVLGGSLILWYQLPQGFNCRHVWLLSVGFLWHASAFVTWISYSSRFATGKYHWYFTLIKDACVAVPSLLAMFLSGVGMFNSCYCWAGLVHWSGGKVPMTETAYLANAKSVYPSIVGATLTLELGIVMVVAIIWRKGLFLLRWSETVRRREWEHVADEKCCECFYMHNDQRGERLISQSSVEPLLQNSTVGGTFRARSHIY